MTRKDYVLIAEAVAASLAGGEGDGPEGRAALYDVTRKLMDRLEADNPNFDRKRFAEAALGKGRAGAVGVH